MAITIPNTQVLSSTTFTSPREIIEEQALTIPELYEWHAIHSPNHPLFQYHDGQELRKITYSEAVPAVRRAANLVTSVVNSSKVSTDADKPPIIAVLASTDTVTYFTFNVGVMRAGYTVFVISTRNNPAAVTHLLARTGAKILFTGHEDSVRHLAKQSIDDLGDAKTEIETHLMPVFDDLYDASKGSDDASTLPTKFDRDARAIIMHSSGSTNLPKPVPWTHRAFFNCTLNPWFGEIDFSGLVVGGQALPMFHAMGVLQIPWAVSCGLIVGALKPSSPAIFPTPSVVFDSVLKSESNMVCCVPTFVEQWSRDADKVEHMKTMKGIIYGGGPLTKEIGDSLSAQGVKLYNIFGSTELLVFNVYLPHDTTDWEYIAFSKHVRQELVPYGDGTYELVMIKHELHEPRFLNTKVGDQDAYATSDLFVPHPTKPGLWKIYGRADDQIALSNGEKTNPGPLESILAQDPRVQSAIIFGRGRFQIGALVDPKAEFAFDPQDTAKLTEFRNAIWPTVERLNAVAPQHSRLFKEMISVALPSKPFAYTAKGTPRRHVIIKMYEDEINSLYDAVEQTVQKDIDAPSSWEYDETLDFVRTVIQTVLTHPVADEDDIFQHGCDSLQATWIRNTILRALRDSFPEVVKRLSVNFVYHAPTIIALAQHLIDIIDSIRGRASRAQNKDKISVLQDMIKKYSADFPPRPSSLQPTEKGADVVLLTGTTGGLGSDILSHMLHDESVVRVYAFNRPSPDVAERQRTSFRERGLDEGDLSSPKFVPVEGDLSLPKFGLSDELYEEIRDSVTHIMHNAWRVDFNLSIVSFERNIHGTRNLVDLALSSPHKDVPRLLFVASIGMFQNPKFNGPALEEPIDDPSVVVGSGYGESKWVVESILNIAAKETELRPVSVRLGQVSGNLAGYWNTREWFPSLVKSALFQRCLPEVDGAVSWIPSYDAAAALAEMRNSPYSTLHLVHPRPVPWSTIIQAIAQELRVPLVPYQQWLDALHGAVLHNSEDVERFRENPALRLLEFYSNAKFEDDKEPLGIAKLDIRKALEVAPSLDLPQLGVEHAHKWVAAWRAAGFLPPRA